MKHLSKYAALVLTFCLLFVTALETTVHATIIDPFASEQLSSYSADTIAVGNGELIIEYYVIGTNTMDSIGARRIGIQEKNAQGNWSTVKTFYSSTTAGMLSDDSTRHLSTLTYSGTTGKEYRSVISFYAKNSLGSDSATYTTTSTIA